MSATHFTGPVVSSNGFSGSAVAAAAGAGAGSTVTSDISKVGKIINTQIFVDLTGAGSSTTDLDIIGTGTSPAYIAVIDSAKMGQVYAVTMTCLEAPLTGVTSVDLYSTDDGTGVLSDIISSEAGYNVVVTASAAWTLNKVQTAVPATDVPSTGDYLYLTCGAAGTPATYTAGQFVIELWGYEA
jgi:hypothetical protein